MRDCAIHVTGPVTPRRRRAGRPAMKSLLRSGVFWILVTEVCFALMRMATRWGAVDLPGWEIGGVRFLGGATECGLVCRRGHHLRVRGVLVRARSWDSPVAGRGAGLWCGHPGLGPQPCRHGR
jgi:hypothetical protein